MLGDETFLMSNSTLIVVLPYAQIVTLPDKESQHPNLFTIGLIGILLKLHDEINVYNACKTLIKIDLLSSSGYIRCITNILIEI